MKQFIFKRLEDEIEALDSQILSQYSSLFKAFRQRKYSSYISCISLYNPKDLTSTNHQECLKTSESTNIPLTNAFDTINQEKSRLYICLNEVHTRSEGNIEDFEAKKKIEKCLEEFKSRVYRTFAEIKL